MFLGGAHRVLVHRGSITLPPLMQLEVRPLSGAFLCARRVPVGQAPPHRVISRITAAAIPAPVNAKADAGLANFFALNCPSSNVICIDCVRLRAVARSHRETMAYLPGPPGMRDQLSPTIRTRQLALLDMKSQIKKHSIYLDGKKTSVSLEDIFLESLKEIARCRKVTLSELIRTINAERQHANLSSALRLFVVDFYREQIGMSTDDANPIPG